MKRKHIAWELLLTGLLLAGCGGEPKKIVAVSQCSMDEWRNQMHLEMKREAFFHRNLQVEIHSTSDNTEQQIKDIEGFISRKVDAIVVAPNEQEPLRPVIERAYDAGIPVVMVDRKVPTEKYTAFVGGDNVEVGRQAARHILALLPRGGNIVEIEGLPGSSSSQERKQGLHQVLDTCPQIRIVAHFAADWKRRRAQQQADSLVPALAHEPVDLVFAYNDRMAIGAHEAFRKAYASGKLPAWPRLPLFIGVDALPDDSIGVGRVADGTLEGSFLYRTGGDKAIQTVAAILAGMPYERETVLETTLIGRANVDLLRMQASHLGELDKEIVFMSQKLDTFFDRYNAQRLVAWSSALIAVLVCVLLAVVARLFVLKRRMNRNLRQKNAELQLERNRLAEQKEVAERQRDELEQERERLIEAQLSQREKQEITEEIEEVEERGRTPQEEAFVQRLAGVIEKRMADSQLSVDQLAAEMNLGRVQLYRRTKALTGQSPNEMLRHTRLQRARSLLLEGRRNISEAAYDVGFTSPSYFAKCYKDLFGENPTEMLRSKKK